MAIKLTDSQKDLIRWLVREVRNGNLTEEFKVEWFKNKGKVSKAYFKGDNLPIITKGVLDALAEAKLLFCIPDNQTIITQISQIPSQTRQVEQERSRICRLTADAYEAVDSNFELPQPILATQQNIGTVIQGNISGGTFQSIGLANAPVSQVVNDPALLQSQVEPLISQLIEMIKPELTSSDLIEYIRTANELKHQLLTEVSPPDQSLFKKLVGTLSFLDVVNGTTDLMVKVWPLIYSLLQIANALGKGLPG